MNKTLRIVIVSIAALLLIGVVIGVTYSFFTYTPNSSLSKFELGNVEISFSESSNVEVSYLPGTTIIKDPTVTVEKGNPYVRVIVEFYDADTNELITDQSRLMNIANTISYDPTYNLNNNPVTSKLVPGVSYKTTDRAFSDYRGNYTSPQTASVIAFNTSTFTLDRSSSLINKLVFVANKGNPTTEGSTYTLFTNIVVPSNWGNSRIDTMGNFVIKLRAEAVQSSGFSSYSEAFSQISG